MHFCFYTCNNQVKPVFTSQYILCTLVNPHKPKTQFLWQFKRKTLFMSYFFLLFLWHINVFNVSHVGRFGAPVLFYNSFSSDLFFSRTKNILQTWSTVYCKYCILQLLRCIKIWTEHRLYIISFLDDTQLVSALSGTALSLTQLHILVFFLDQLDFMLSVTAFSLDLDLTWLCRVKEKNIFIRLHKEAR